MELLDVADCRGAGQMSADVVKALPDEIMEAVERALPALQVNALRDALNELEELRANVQTLISERDKEHKRYQSELSTSNSIAQKLDVAQTTIAKLESERDTYKQQARDTELESMRAALSATTETTDKFLRNTIFREKLQRQVINEQPVFTTNYVNGYPQQTQTGTTKVHQPVTETRETQSE